MQCNLQTAGVVRHMPDPDPEHVPLLVQVPMKQNVHVVSRTFAQAARMPPIATNIAIFPPSWLPFFLFYQDRYDGGLVLGAVALFDGAVRDGRMSDRMRIGGFPAVSIDSENTPKQNVRLASALQIYVDTMARLAPDSIQWMAPPCASWVVLPRSHTGRSAEEPLGCVCRHTWGPT